MIRKPTILLGAMLALLAGPLAACNTVAGIGKDVKALDREIRGSDASGESQSE